MAAAIEAVDAASVATAEIDVAHLIAMIGHPAMEETTGSPRADATVGQYPEMTIDGVQDPAAAEEHASTATEMSIETATVETDPVDMMGDADEVQAHVHAVPSSLRARSSMTTSAIDAQFLCSNLQRVFVPRI